MHGSVSALRSVAGPMNARTNENHRAKSRPLPCSFAGKGSRNLKLNPTAWIYVIIVDSHLCLISLLEPISYLNVKFAVHFLTRRATWTAATSLFFFLNSCAHFIISFAKSWAKLSIIAFILFFFFFLLAVSDIRLKAFCCFEIWVLFLWVYSSFLSVRTTTSLRRSWVVITSAITLLRGQRHQTTIALNHFFWRWKQKWMYTKCPSPLSTA